MAKKKKPAKPQPKSKVQPAKPHKAKAKATPAPKKPLPKVGRAAAPAPARGKRRSSWLDENSHKPLIDKSARQLRSFISAMADGRIDDAELEVQEARLIDLMKEIEPQLDDSLHTKVTQLLCELTAYDLMRTLHSINANRPKTVFQG
jgi:hypothetical protein